jgi:CheY-like chemotaxis protein
MSTSSIIVVDDNSIYLALIKELLIEEGYPRVHCLRGLAVFDVICQEQPTLVILDINSAHPDEGWSLLDLVRLHPSTSHIPLIICSTDPYILRERAAWLAEMRCDTLEKPFDLDALLDKVRAVLGPPLEQARVAAK